MQIDSRSIKDGHYLYHARARLIFRCEPPIRQQEFPCPALRGLLGWCLASLPTVAAKNFLNERFHPDSPDLPSWRMWCEEPPDEEKGVFAVYFGCFGSHASLDLREIVSAFQHPVGTLTIRNVPHRIELQESDACEEHQLSPLEAKGDWRTEPRPLWLHFHTPLLMRSGKTHYTANELTPEKIMESARNRFSRIQGQLRIRDLPPLPKASILENRLMDVELPITQSRKQRQHRGIMGSLCVEAHGADALHWLKMGMLLGVGASVSYGLGAYSVEA